MFTLCMSRGPPAPHNAATAAADACGRTVATNKQVKGGYLLRYRRGFFWRGWSEEWVVLYEDSTLAWYSDKGAGRARGCVRLRDAPELLAVGEWTRRAPRRPPRLPRAASVAQLLAVAGRGPHPPDVYWLVGRSAADINEWMTAISNTLPPPPHLPLDNKRLSLPTSYTETTLLANGRLNDYHCNGNAIAIPNGNVPHEPVYAIIAGDNKPDANQVVKTPKQPPPPPPRQKSTLTNRNYDNDHTILEGVVIQWGHGWGWSTLECQAPIMHDPIPSAAFFGHTGDGDYGADTGMDVVDWCSFGDFGF